MKRSFCSILFILILTISIIMAGCFLFENTSESKNTYDYTPTLTMITEKYINASTGGIIEITDSDSFIQGAKLTIPGDSLTLSTTITIGEINNPPELPDGLNYVGSVIDFGPDNLDFNNPLTIEIPYYDTHLSDAGILDDTTLKLYYYDQILCVWNEVNIISLDTTNNIISAQINHFSYYAITGLNASPPDDLGTPQAGDLLYKTGEIFSEKQAKGWRPGHVGIYVGEKTYNGNPYNVIEALAEGVIRSYYNTKTEFGQNDIYMGAREPANNTLTLQQRKDIVAFAEAQVGKPYAWAQTAGALFGMLAGSLVKGPDSFNCVGLAEKAYEEAGVNGGSGLVSWIQENISIGLPPALTPAEQYNATKPAAGSNPPPTEPPPTAPPPTEPPPTAPPPTAPPPTAPPPTAPPPTAPPPTAPPPTAPPPTAPPPTAPPPTTPPNFEWYDDFNDIQANPYVMNWGSMGGWGVQIVGQYVQEGIGSAWSCTNISTASLTSYVNNIDESVNWMKKSFDLGDYNLNRVTFYYWYYIDSEAGYDKLKICAGLNPSYTNITVLKEYSGHVQQWQFDSVDLSPFIGNNEVYLFISFGSDGLICSGYGAGIDNVALICEY